MSAALGQPLGGRLTETREYLRAEFGYGTTTEIAELFRTLAVICVQKQVTRVRIVAGDDDPLVATAERVRLTYRNAQRDLCAAGITARLFGSEADAKRWLDSADVSTQEYRG